MKKQIPLEGVSRSLVEEEERDGGGRNELSCSRLLVLLVNTWNTWKAKITGERGDWTAIAVSCHMEERIQKYNEEKNAGPAPSHIGANSAY